MEMQGNFAGHLEYYPRLDLQEDKQYELSNKLVEAGLIQEPENPIIVIDWYFAEEKPGQTISHQASVILFRDGGEFEEPACLFFRLDFDLVNRSTQELIHIPPRKRQAELTGAWKWWEDPTGEQLSRLVSYLTSLMNDESAWKEN